MTQEPNNKMKSVLISLALLAAVGIAVWAALSLDPRGDRGAGTGRDYDKEFQKLKKFDLSLVKWSEELPAIPARLDLPTAITVLDDGRICIGGDKAVLIFSSDRLEVTKVDLPFEPQALACFDKTLYVAAANSISTLTSAGTDLQQWVRLDKEKTQLVSLAASDEYVYASDAGNRIMVRIDRKTGRQDPEAFMSGFNVPSPHLDIAVSPAGELITVDPGRLTVQVRDSYGDVLDSWGSEGSDITKFYGCCNPAAIATLADGSIVTYEKTLQRLKVFTPKGKLINVAAGPNDFTDQPKETNIVPDIAVDKSGRILVLDPIRKTLRTFKRKIAPRPATGAAR